MVLTFIWWTGIWWAGWYYVVGSACFILFWFLDTRGGKEGKDFKDIFTWSNNTELIIDLFTLFLIIIPLMPLVTVVASFVGWFWLFADTFRFIKNGSFLTPERGVSLMKKRLISWTFLILLGMVSPNIGEKVLEWYKAPPSPPSKEALQLVHSLEDTKGWIVWRGEATGDLYLKRGEVKIKPGIIWSTIYINDGNASGQFSYTDLRAINRVASPCMRRLTSQSVERALSSK